MMKLSFQMRRFALFGLLAGTVAAAVSVRDTQGDHFVIEPAVGGSAARSGDAVVGIADKDVLEDRQDGLLSLVPRNYDGVPVELFRVPPPPPSMESVKPVEEKPVAPPLPIKYLGRIEQDGGVVVLLSHNGKDLTLRSGDGVGGNYKIEEITATLIRFTYLPLNETQILRIGAVN